MKVLSAGETSIFCEQLAMVLKAGIPILEGIGMMKEELEDKRTWEILAQIEKALEVGSKVYEALEDAGVFPFYMIHMVKIGFESGKPEEVLNLLARYYEKKEEITQGVRRVLLYPLILLGIMCTVILVISTQVLPVFQHILEDLGMQMSGMAMGMMKAGTAITQWSVGIMIGLLIVGIGTGLYVKIKGKEVFIKKLLMRFKAYEKLELQRFTAAMSLMVSSGLDTEYAMGLACSMVEHEEIKKKIEKSLENVRQGKTFATAVGEQKLFSNLAVRMLMMGTMTGCLEEMMSKVSLHYEEDVEASLERIIASIEPVVIVILAIVIGSILVSVMFPLMSIMSAIG